MLSYAGNLSSIRPHFSAWAVALAEDVPKYRTVVDVGPTDTFLVNVIFVPLPTSKA